MTDQERPHYSHSQFRIAFGDGGCLRAYKYRYLDKIKTPVPGRMHVGTTWDRMVNAVLRSKIDGDQLDAAQATDLAVETLDNPPEHSKDGEPLDYDFSDIDIDSTKQRLEFAANIYIASVVPDIRPVTVQHEVRLPILDGTHDMLGYIDLVEYDQEGALCVTDNKASSSGRSTYTTDKAQIDPQLLSYQAALNLMPLSGHEGRVMSRAWRIVDIGYKRTLARFDNVRVTERSITDTIVRAQNTLRSIEDQAIILNSAKDTGSFPPTGIGSWKCSAKYCDFYGICEYGSANRTAIAITNNEDEQD